MFDSASQGKELALSWSTLIIAQQDAAKLGAHKSFTPFAGGTVLRSGRRAVSSDIYLNNSEAWWKLVKEEQQCAK